MKQNPWLKSLLKVHIKTLQRWIWDKKMRLLHYLCHSVIFLKHWLVFGTTPGPSTKCSFLPVPPLLFQFLYDLDLKNEHSTVYILHPLVASWCPHLVCVVPGTGDRVGGGTEEAPGARKHYRRKGGGAVWTARPAGGHGSLEPSPPLQFLFPSFPSLIYFIFFPLSLFTLYIFHPDVKCLQAIFCTGQLCITWFFFPNMHVHHFKKYLYDTCVQVHLRGCCVQCVYVSRGAHVHKCMFVNAYSFVFSSM